MILLIVVVGFQFFYTNETRAQRLHLISKTQIQEGDFIGAVINLERVINLTPKNHEQVFDDMLLAIDELGDVDKRELMLSQIAPESGKPGVASGHRLRAIELAKEIGQGKIVDLKRLRWHLQHSGNDESVGTMLAWARYSIATGNSGDAAMYFRSAARLDPIYWLNVAKIYEGLSKRAEWDAALVEARFALQQGLSCKPEDERTRLALAEVHFKLKQFDACDALLAEGIEKYSSARIKRARSELLIAKFLGPKDTNSFDRKLQLAGEAFALDSGRSKPQQIFLYLYQSVNSNQQKQCVIELLKSFSAGDSTDEKAGDAEFVLAEIFAIENDHSNAIAAAEKALRQKPNDPDRLHLLARSLATAPIPDLVRSEKLVRQSVAKDPANHRFRLTLGTILMRSSRYQESITEMQKALLNSRGGLSDRNKIAIHTCLSRSYRELSQFEMAEAHARRAQSQ